MKYASTKKLLFSISVIILVTLACRSKQNKPADIEQPNTIEYPKPIGDAKTDSLKQVIEEKRKQRKK
jgi:hypothetical protein